MTEPELEPEYQTHGWWADATREQIVSFLEEERCIACFAEESTDLLREAAAEDFPVYMEELGLKWSEQ